MDNYQDYIFGLSTTSFWSIAFFIFIIYAVSQWKIYEKAGQPGWAALIPIVNVYFLLKIIGKPTWWMLLLFFVPFVNFIIAIWMVNLLAKSFGRGIGCTIGLLLFGVIFYPILGFGDAKYIGPAGK